jgi:hypothetical protein
MQITSGAGRAMSRLGVRRRVLPAVALVALAFAGCGGDSKKDDDKADAAKAKATAAAAFKTGAKAATTETTKIGDDLGTAIQDASKQTDAALAAQFTSLASRARGVVGDLNALETPQASRAEVTALVGALTTGAQDLDAIATAARAHDASSARSATQTLVQDSPAIKTAKDALETEIGVKPDSGTGTGTTTTASTTN